MQYEVAPMESGGPATTEDASALPLGAVDAEIETFIKKAEVSSVAEIDQLMAKLQATKNFLQSEGERVHREAARYTNLTQTASASIRIIFDTVREWRRAGHPVRDDVEPQADMAFSQEQENMQPPEPRGADTSGTGTRP